MEIGSRVTINGTNSIWDGKEGIVEAIDEEGGTCTIFVDFNPEQGKRIRQDFSLDSVESLQEAYRDKSSGKTGELIKDYKNGYGLFKANDGSKFDVDINNIEEVEDKPQIQEAMHAETTESFDQDYEHLDNPSEADWFLSDEGSDSLNILRVNGLNATIRMRRAKQETISSNNKYKGNVTVYSLFKGEGSSNQFRAYFYRDGDTCIFVRCLLKKRNKNGPEEEKAIQDTINYALGHKNVDKK